MIQYQIKKKKNNYGEREREKKCKICLCGAPPKKGNKIISKTILRKKVFAFYCVCMCVRDRRNLFPCIEFKVKLIYFILLKTWKHILYLKAIKRNNYFNER